MPTPIDANAQVPATATENPQVQTPTPAPQPSPEQAQFAGFQKRIDEITAKSHEKDEALRRVQEQYQQTLLLLAQRAHEPTPPPPSAPQLPEDLDPAVKQAILAQQQFMAQQNQRAMAQMMAQTGNVQLQQTLVGENPLVAQRTHEIWQDAVSKGAHLSGFTPEQAKTYARGQLFDQLMAERQNTAAAQSTVAAGQRMSGVLPVATQSPPSVSGVPQPGAAPDLNDDPEAAAAYYQQRLGDKAF